MTRTGEVDPDSFAPLPGVIPYPDRDLDPDAALGVHVIDWADETAFYTPAEARAYADSHRHEPGWGGLFEQEHLRSLDYMADAAEREIPKTLTLTEWEDEDGLTVEIFWTKETP